MRKTSLILIALLLAQPCIALAQDYPEGGEMGGDGDDGGPGMERPHMPSPPKPVARESFDKVVTAMFRDADTNRDGIVTLDELHATVAARRDAAIRDRFAQIDTNHDKAISLAEFTAWQTQMGSVALSDSGAKGDAAIVADAIMPPHGNGRDERMVARLVEPLTGTVIALANTDHDAGVSLPELIAYEGKRFDAADTNHDGWLTMQELRAAAPRDGMGGWRGRRGPGPAGEGPQCAPDKSCP